MHRKVMVLMLTCVLFCSVAEAAWKIGKSDIHIYLQSSAILRDRGGDEIGALSATVSSDYFTVLIIFSGEAELLDQTKQLRLEIHGPGFSDEEDIIKYGTVANNQFITASFLIPNYNVSYLCIGTALTISLEQGLLDNVASATLSLDGFREAYRKMQKEGPGVFSTKC